MTTPTPKPTPAEPTAAPRVTIERCGTGSPLVVLHGEDGLRFCGAFLDALSTDRELVLPRCPGWAGEALPVWLRSVDEMSYRYLDVLEAEFAGRPQPAVGISFGAWLLLEIATKNPWLFSSLVLVAPIGVKLSGRETRQFADLFAMGLTERAATLHADPTGGLDPATLDDESLHHLAVAEEALARLGWEPHLHSPGLVHRLHRVRCPVTIVRGRQDRFVLTEDYHERLADALGGPTATVLIDGAGHRVDQDQPERLRAAVLGHLRDTEPTPDERGWPHPSSHDRLPEPPHPGTT